MAPKKKGEKMSLNAFLEDSALGSWADEMDSLPTAPAPREDDGSGRYGGGDRDFGRRGGDFLSSRPDRGPAPPREDVPLPTVPPYTAFVGNLAFDLTESELGSFFAPHEAKSVKIIRDRDDKPKGFGYVEFANLDGLKDALAKNGASFSNRSIRVNVAEPPKERSGGFGGSGDDDKFSGDWRRTGPLPDLPGRGDGAAPRRRFEGISSEGRDSVSDGSADWRSNRPPPRFPAEPEGPPSNRRRGSGFSTPAHEGELSPADAEDKWTIGSKFKPAPGPDAGGQPGSRFGSMRGRGDMGPPPATTVDEGDWRRAKPARNSTSPTSSVPSTPQMTRRKLELLPRSTSGSAQPTPLSSPKAASHGTSSTAKANPFGAAKPVDVTAREAAVLEKIEKEREEVKERVAQHAISRNTSRQARERPTRGDSSADGTRSPQAAPAPLSSEASASSPPATTPSSPRPSAASTNSSVRPAFSFANAAKAKREAAAAASQAASAAAGEEGTPASGEEPAVEQATEKLGEVAI